MKKLFTIITILLLCVCLFSCKKESTLPLPELDSGMRGELGIDKNINEKTVDNYLNRSDAVYRDMRMLKDEANYEAIGGDSHLSGYIKGFEVISYPYLCNPQGLPTEVGEGYKGNALFSQNEDGTYTPNYEESLSIIEEVFPKDKVIFLMCGGGGYAGMTKNLLVSLGYDANKIYDIGGFWYYEGKNAITTKKQIGNETYYDYDSLIYHDIDFDSLKPINGYIPKDYEAKEENSDVSSSKMINVNSLKELNDLQENKTTFLLYVYLPGCTSCAAFKPIVDEFIDANKVDIYQINYQLLKDEDNIVKSHIDYTPSIFIFIDGELKAFLDPKSDKDLDFYKTTENLSNWINKYIDVEIVKTDTKNETEECGDTACKL